MQKIRQGAASEAAPVGSKMGRNPTNRPKTGRMRCHFVSVEFLAKLRRADAFAS